MKSLTTRQRAFAALLSTGFLLAGCSGGATQAPTAASSAAAASAAAAAAPSAAAPSAAAAAAPSAAAPSAAAPSAAAASAAAAGAQDFSITPGALAGKKIAFLSQGASNEWAVQLDAVARVEATKTGAQLLYFDAQGNADAQVGQMEDAITEGANAIVVVALGAGELVGQEQRALAAGIPVINCVTGVTGTDYTSFVGWDWGGMYARAAQWLVTNLNGTGNILMLNGQAGTDTSDLAQKAAEAVFAKYPGIKIVGQSYANFSIATAKQQTETFLAKGLKIDGIYVNGGEAAEGSIQAYVDAGVKPIPIQAGTNAENGAIRVLEQNNVKFMGIPSPPSASFTCMEIAGQVLLGKPVQKNYNMSEVGGFKDFYSNQMNGVKYYPQYADGYQDPTNQFLTQAQLKADNLLAP